MKKLLAIVLTGMICVASLCMTACTSEEAVPREYITNEIAEVLEEHSEPMSEEASESFESGFDEESDAFIGRMEGRTYINEYFDFYCAMDNNWDITSEEDLILSNQQSILSWNPSVEGVDALSWNDASVGNMLEKISIDMILMEAKARGKSLVILVQKTGFTTEEECSKFLEDYA